MSIRKALHLSLVTTTLFCAAVPLPQLHAAAVPVEGFADIVEPLLPCVVNISTTSELREKRNNPLAQEMPNFPPGSPFEELFRYFMDEGMANRPRKTTALGSGFIIDEAGYIVTNSHVIADADQILVTLKDGTELPATLVGKDRRTDLAVLKISTDKKLASIKWGDSSKVRSGDSVIAIGNAYGLGGTVTTGTVSTIARDISSKMRGLGVGDYIEGFIQTDASINLGNSGGPLFSARGEVIGINTAIFSPSGGSIGLGFAVPSEIAKPVIEQLKKFGRTKRGWIGVYIQPLSPEIAQELKLKNAEGALIGTVPPEGPAANAKILPGDVILSFNGVKVKNDRDLRHLVGEGPIGKSVPLVVWRKGREVPLSVEIKEFEDAEDKGLINPADPTTQQPKTGTVSLGLRLQPLSPELRDRFEIPTDAKGVVITDVSRDSEAAEKGLRPGDIIFEVSQIPVLEPLDVVKQIESAKKAGRKNILLQIGRGKMLHHIILKIEDDKELKDKVPPKK